MAKDPAVMFYTSDFLTGTLLMNYAQKGKYITLLCLQHQQGHLSEDDMLSVCGSYDEKVFSKFLKDENGNYYNERMELEAIKRKKFVESRQNNLSKNNSKEVHLETHIDSHMERHTGKHTELRMENENTNVNIDKDVFNNIAVKNIAFNNEFDEIWKLYPNKQGREKARTSYIKARKEGIERETIENGVNRYVEYCKSNSIDRQYIKHGSTWFNQRSWNDDYTIETNVEIPKYSNTSADDSLERALARTYETSSY